MTDLRIFLATPHPGYEQRLRQAFDGTLNGDLRRWDADATSVDGSLLHQLADDRPDVVALGPGLSVDDALAAARQLELERPEISVLLVSEPSTELWEQALRSGIRDVLAPDALDADVRGAFERALEVAERRRRNLVGVEEEATGGRIITVLSPKGGSGKTTVSTNLALGLALEAPDSTAIVDLDLQFGDVATALRLTPQHSLVDAARSPVGDDALALKSFLTPHVRDLWCLCGPESPAEGEEVTAERARAMVQTLASEFPYVVVDTCAGITEHALSVIEISTDLVFVCAMDVPSVRSLRKEIDALEQLGMTHQRRHLVINRADAKVGLDIKDVEATVGLPVDVAVPSSRLVPLSVNQGSPVVESEPRSPVAKQFGALVHRFTADTAVADAQPSRRRRMFR